VAQAFHGDLPSGAYCGYETYDFAVPVGQGKFGPLGSCWDRYYVRVREMEGTVKIIRQALASFPKGTFKKKSKKVKPPKGEVYGKTRHRVVNWATTSSATAVDPFRVKTSRLASRRWPSCR
jgi:NADH-quinone oxidoreductase subunit D